MANEVCDIALVNSPLAVNDAFEISGAGGIVVFLGNVRPMEAGKPIMGLDYEAHGPMARHQLQVVAESAIKRFGLLGVRLHHRIGYVPAGETSLALHVAAAHRGPAFDASKWMVEELKKRVPIWKTPVFETAGDLTKAEAVSVSRS